MPFAATAVPASADEAHCYTDGPDGGLIEASNFDNAGDCEFVVHGYWL